ncbi:bifunctional phosphopantothenoylcysteine decarboxylase/phosphopantothenate--cysteine ligase CoaBC [Paracnuella aquatica]|uniref:bifunctional phosphopantothenoylcysteine decarboxylase/phosphopantothenate--cysteine ligase CoaBC n=1 Tax=Paracnuella aquatica TaxID=2268757 RepID=UPI000DEF5CCF|nr:bifunctional phosphopantothenoylcysteine decarboxylase/phosphopantothenate--cysteine ligase CoaBC [Paracnuella aquatica]RPD48963.1 bifunctional phosphopantothenoylcysteine decarboxylase/phosphopantothenate--cysteine ligase CoaBC [Paracnuella aquatica]
MFSGKKVLIGISGSIAAYKIVHLVRLLVKEGAEVKVVMTHAAKDFVSPLTLSTLSKNEVLSDLFEADSWANHVALGRWADLLLVAPLSCNTLAKMANGLCDNLLLATYLSATCPVMVAPAMDEDMWHHPTTRENLGRLAAHGCHVLPVAHGELASGLIGEGRMAQPEAILEAIHAFLITAQDFNGKKVLITAGPTYEAIDPVRFIGNHSSGKMGYALAKEFQRRGAAVTVVSGPVSLPALPAPIETVKVQSAGEMYAACMEHAATYDIAVMAAAVADFTPGAIAPEKIKKSGAALTLNLEPTKDILATLGNQKRDGQVLIGFALETNNEEANARQKLERKNADAIVLNSLNDTGAGFGKATNKITILIKDGQTYFFETKTKEAVATDIANTVLKLIP